MSVSERELPLPRNEVCERAALSTLDAFMERFSEHDWHGCAATFNYPHVRLAAGKVKIWASAEEYAADVTRRIEQTFERGWDRSSWDIREVVHGGQDKVHLKVRFSRYDASGGRLATYDSLWIVTCQDGHWGVQMRSSYAP